VLQHANVWVASSLGSTSEASLLSDTVQVQQTTPLSTLCRVREHYVSLASPEGAYASPVEVSVSPEEDPMSLVVASDSLAVASIYPVSPLCKGRLLFLW
jgi:hypothetical protein